MMESALLALLALGDPTASFRFSVIDLEDPRVRGRLELSGLAEQSEPIELRFPEGFAFARLPEPLLDGEVKVLESAGATLQRTSPYSWSLDPAGADAVTLEWVVPLRHREHPMVAGRDEYEYPYLKEDHGMLVMGCLALLPSEFDEATTRVEFKVPEAWPVVAPWPKTADGAYHPPTRGALADDLIAIGHWQLDQQQVAGMNVTFAFAPHQEELRKVVLERAAPIVEAELQHFGVTPQPAYLFLFGEPQRAGYGGSPKTNSMTLFVDRELPMDFVRDGIVHLIAHEFHHTWMRARCQPVSDLRFVVEGYTDYFAYRIPWQIGLADDASFQDRLERKMAELEAAQSASEMDLFTAGGDAFFQGGDSYRATYAGGLIHALWLDLALRGLEEPSSTEDVLRALYEDPRWQDGTRPQPSDLWACIERLGGAEIAQRARELAATPGFADWQAAFAAVGVELVRSTAPGSLQMRANFNGTTMGLSDPAGAAARVGLLPGDRLLEVNGVAVESEADVRRAFPELLDGELQLRLERDGEELLIKTMRPTDVRYRFADKVFERLR